MARSNYSFGKRQRELEKAKKKKEKAARKRDRSGSGGDIPIATVEELQGGDNLMSIDEVMQSMQGGDAEGGAPQARTIPSRLFVGGLAWRVTTEQLRTKFEEIGPVNDAVVVLDRDTGDSRGFGFVTMADRKDAGEAIRKLNGVELDGRALVVRQATERNR
ncbi:MAG: hypothetical protein AAGF11_22800 [Myxococcota bacterium]